MDRKELNYTNELTYTLAEIEDRERLQADCDKLRKVNKGMQYIKADAIKMYNELEMDFMVENDLTEDEYSLVNKVFRYLKQRA